jgi:cytochrome P450
MPAEPQTFVATELAGAEPFFVPPRPAFARSGMRLLDILAAVRTNALAMWSREAYEADFLVGRFFARRSVLINAPDGIHRVLVQNSANYRRTPASIRILRPIVGKGLLLSEGDEWRHQRRTIAPALAPRVVPVLARHVASAAHEMVAEIAAAHDEPIDMLAAVQLLALEIAARSMFSLEMRRYGAAMRQALARFAAGLARPYLFDILLPPTIPTLRDFARMRFRMSWLRLIDEIMAARLAAAASETPRDLFDLLVAGRDPETGAAFPHAMLRDQVATMVVAGHETTALALFWSSYLLASAQAEQKRVAQEVEGADLSPEAAAEALQRIPYTRAVVNEALRLYPPAFAIFRQAIAADRCGEVAIPRGAVVIISPWVLHRHVRLWDDPDAFIPARFFGHEPPHRYAFLPFGAGPRVCIGAHFALAEAALVLAILVKNFELALAEARPVLPVAVVTTRPDHAVPFRLRARASTGAPKART